MIYLDSCILIYAIESFDSEGEGVRATLAATRDTAAVSPLVLHECLVKPLRDHNWELRDRYMEAYAQFHTIALDLDVFTRAAELRAASGMKTPDALHVAAAQSAYCAELWTNDHRLASATHGLAVNVLA